LARALFGALDRVGDAQLKTGVVAAIPGGVESELVACGRMKCRRSRQCRSVLQIMTITVRSGAASNRYASATLSRGSRVASWVSK
jgi:hypothetical protein